MGKPIPIPFSEGGLNSKEITAASREALKRILEFRSEMDDMRKKLLKTVQPKGDLKKEYKRYRVSVEYDYLGLVKRGGWLPVFEKESEILDYITQRRKKLKEGGNQNSVVREQIKALDRLLDEYGEIPEEEQEIGPAEEENTFPFDAGEAEGDSEEQREAA